MKLILKNMVESHLVASIKVDGLEGQEYFVNRSDVNAAIRVQKKIHILSPFDNFTIQRNRLQHLFNYNYQIECYVPKTKRKWGYFCLPILYGYHFIGRVDAKADRKSKILIIKQLYFEDEKYKRIPISEWQQAFYIFALFNNCENVLVEACSDKDFLVRLKSQFQ